MPNRPNFDPNQIREISEIGKDLKIFVCDTGGYRIKATVLEAPYENRSGWHLKVEFERNNQRWSGTLNLADHSVVADRRGDWNRYNWIEKQMTRDQKTVFFKTLMPERAFLTEHFTADGRFDGWNVYSDTKLIIRLSSSMSFLSTDEKSEFVDSIVQNLADNIYSKFLIAVFQTN